jgi:hypothetical protein
MVKELKQLEAGQDFCINGRVVKLKGTVALLSADNPASCACGGFKDGGTAHRFCRQCLVTDKQSKEIVMTTGLINIVIYYTIFSSKRRS